MSKGEAVEVEEVNLKSLFGDGKIMNEIEEKAKSKKKEDILEALGLFEKNWEKLPNKAARDFIYNMRENEDNGIKEKAEEVYNISFTEMDERVENVRKNLGYMTGSYRASFLPIQSQMKELSRAFGVSKQMASIAKTIPSVVFDMQKSQPFWEELRRFQNILNESVKIYSPIKDIQTAYSPMHIIPSPILRAKSLFSKVTDKELESKRSFSEILEKEEKEIEEEIKFISEQNGDITFNFTAYEFLWNVEYFLRNLIQVIIIEPYKTNLKNRIPPDLIKNWESRKEEEERNPLMDGNYELIDYSDFTDLKRIFEKGRNYELFADIINQEQFKVVISKLHELDPIRKKIAHYRPLSEKEFDRLKSYTDEIIRMFNRS